MIETPDHAGDRVIYDFREWQVTYKNGHPFYYVSLLATDGSGEVREQVNMSHLRTSWCPTSHGGKGKFTVSPGDIVRTDGENHTDKVVCEVGDYFITVMWGDNNRRQYTRAEITSVSPKEVHA